MVLVPVDIVPEVHHECFESGEMRDDLGHEEAMHAHLNLRLRVLHVCKGRLLHLWQNIHVGCSNLAGLFGLRRGKLLRLDLAPLGGFEVALSQVLEKEAQKALAGRPVRGQPIDLVLQGVIAFLVVFMQ